MLNTMKRHGITLALFAAGATGLTAVVNSLTESTIAHQAALQQKALLDQVVPAENYDNDMQAECYVVTDSALGNMAPHRLYLARKEGQPVAAAIETTAPDGYSGAIQLLVGADFGGNVLGSRVIEHHETPGLGDKIDIRISDWISHFSGRHVEGEQDKRWAVKKDGGDFDQFTGATITPRAVVRAVKNTALFLETLPAKLDSLPVCGEDQ
ncbi:electron transport complex subunit RsxG [Yersinia enterocolitica]|uniref:Ion-translocating oxidoreductase complex subunit G n=1 Tax=Yersinia enterocolitica TaxID=630 RepID=A0A0H5H8B5_YEREN|nr:electron transport complex subunit RsxG [Yersinia enterocolitica]EKN3329835.1 electron transport complex subunit RsxG [Yersinia enterocolitica]EKN3495671.1 electron transport complex subunit RsxG [Yersinia enterocolitica]EKN3508657.1 electron transport complex subunit RsxG [Yersinia enterocolitica]EKN3555663.1 electron transport complex subunit RsxG [Yersinia enterocolitica]EKN3691928.1 electron transport complex subunit RsxG [Yersinia enterocolitica]